MMIPKIVPIGIAGRSKIAPINANILAQLRPVNKAIPKMNGKNDIAAIISPKPGNINAKIAPSTRPRAIYTSDIRI
jgi:hypothetical protein